MTAAPAFPLTLFFLVVAAQFLATTAAPSKPVAATAIGASPCDLVMPQCARRFAAVVAQAQEYETRLYRPAYRVETTVQDTSISKAMMKGRIEVLTLTARSSLTIMSGPNVIIGYFFVHPATALSFQLMGQVAPCCWAIFRVITKRKSSCLPHRHPSSWSV
jgi:hypothetical protein